MTDVKTGETLFSEGKIEEAEKCFLDLLKKEPTNAEALNDLGVMQHAKGNVKGAEDLFLKAIAAKQEYLDAYLNLVDLYQDAKRWSEAIAQLEECIQIENKDPNLFNMLGTFCLEMGNTEKARMALIKSLELNPDQELVRDSLMELEKKDAGPQISFQEKPLNILFVQEAPCIRNYKMATALRARGHRVSLAYNKARLSQMYKGLSDDVYDENIQIANFRQLWDISKNYDIVHCHNEPDILTVAALAGDAPVVHDTHDLISLRANGDPNLSYFEGVANRGAAGRVYTTPYQMEEAQKLYGVNGPSVVFHNYVSQCDLPKRTLSKLSARDGKIHIAYEGGIGGNGHRDFFTLFVELARLGNHIHIYPTFYDKEIARYFSEFPNIHYNNPLSPKQIIEAMSQFDLGIIPFNLEKGNKRFLDSTIANKLFEYLAAGLPVLASPLRSYIDYFSKNPVGITFQDVKDIIESIPRLKQLAETTDFSKLIFTYEGEIERLEEFYRAVLNNVSRKVQGGVDEATRARQYWQGRGVIGYYFEEGPQSIGIVNAVKNLREQEDIESVLEFGCNVGRNLYCLRRNFGELRLSGIDINRDAINVGRQHYKLPLVHGGEEKLNEIEDGAYDVVFTVSVLDHIPHVEAVLRELLRIAKKYFIAIEPFSESKEDASKYAVANYSYFWDYPALFSKFGAAIVQDRAYPISDQGLGPFYHLYIVKPVQCQNDRGAKRTTHQISDELRNLREPNGE
jgi:tetratricopeptide (TPR) repeat protein